LGGALNAICKRVKAKFLKKPLNKINLEKIANPGTCCLV
jgi:hypothetical protein